MRAPRLLEREAELATISASVAEAVGGRGRLLVVEGQAGIGKSRLLEAARLAAAEQGFAVLSARCSELERSVAFGAVRQLFEARVASGGVGPLDGASALAAPVFDPGGFDAQPDRDALLARLHGLYWLAASLAAAAPVALIVDDVQWADEASLRYLRYLAPRLADMRVVAVVATRPADDPTASPGIPVLLTDPDVSDDGDEGHVGVAPNSYRPAVRRCIA